MTRLKGILPAALTPLTETLAIDKAKLAGHCRNLVAQGADGVVVFGTTGEAPSFSVAERREALESVAQDIGPEKILVGVGCCAVPDTYDLTRHAVDLGCAGVLVMPPYFYKTVTDEGVFRAHATLIEAMNRPFNFYLYHFPQMSMIPISYSLVERLTVDYPEVVAGIKDSSGDFENMARLARDFHGLDVFSGSDRLFGPLMEVGGAGCITAIANVITPLLDIVRRDPDDEDVLEIVGRIREDFEGRPLTASLKGLMALLTGDESWRRLRPPLVEVSARESETLRRAIEGTGYRFADFS